MELTFPTHLFGLRNVPVVAETSLAPGNFYSGLAAPYLPVYGLEKGFEEPDAPDFISMLGTPVYGSLTLGSTDPNKTNNNQYTGIDGVVYAFDPMVLSNVIIVVNMKKNVNKTTVTGRRNGTIKEYIALGDYDVSIHTVFDKKPGIAPKKEVAQLHKILLAEVPIPVTSYFLNQFGINWIVVEDVEFPQQEGKYSSQAITIRGCSDYQEQEILP